MAQDMIRCPGCGVKMDLSTFAVRPDQVICPRCNTRSAVPPLEAPSAAVKEEPSRPAPAEPPVSPSAPTVDFASAPVVDHGSAPAADAVSASTMGSASAPTMDFVSAPSQSAATAPAPSYESMPAPPVPASMPPAPPTVPLPDPSVAPACGGAGNPVFTAPAPSGMGARSAAAYPSARELHSMTVPTSTLPPPAAPASLPQVAPAAGPVLPIDAKGNTEPLAFALIGLFSIFTLFPPLGLALCIAALMMNAEERRAGLHNDRAGATKAAAVIGIILNALLLVAEIALVISVIMYPTMLLGFFAPVSFL